MARPVLLVLAALGIGIFTGYLLGTPEAPAPARAERTNQPTPSTDKADAAEALPRGSSPLAESLRALPVPTVERGTGTIHGHVKTVYGKPVAGVTLRATRRIVGRGWRKGDGAPEDRELEEAVHRYVEQYYERRLSRAEAVTDARGAYNLTALVERGSYSVRAYLDGYDLRGARGANWNVSPGTKLDFVANQVVDIPVEVLLPNGTRPDQIWILCRAGRNISQEQWTPDRPSIRLAPGEYTLSTKTEDEEYRSDDVERRVVHGQTVERVEFRLKGRPGIRGGVTFGEDFRPEQVNIYALRYGGNLAPREMELARGKHKTFASRKEGYGYRLKDLEPGRYLVGVGLRQQTILQSKTVDVGEGTATCDFEPPPLDPKEYVVVRVLDPDGKPMNDVQFNTAYRTATTSSSRGGTGFQRADGSYFVLHHQHEPGEGGTNYITVQTKAFGKKEVGYKRGETQELEVRFNTPATLSVFVDGYAGSPHQELVALSLIPVTAADNRRFAFSHESKRPDQEGNLALGPVEPGEYEVVLYVQTERHQSLPAVKRTLSLSQGRNETTLVMPRLHLLVVEAKDFKEGANLNLSLAEGPRWSSIRKKVGKDGTVTFSLLPPGRYKLRTWGGPKRGEMIVDVPAQGWVVFKPKEQNALRVTITDTQGSLAGAGFVDGDLVIGIDGKEFENAAQMQMLMGGATAKETVVFNVLRGGRRVDVQVDVKKLSQGGDKEHGGNIQPTSR